MNDQVCCIFLRMAQRVPSLNFMDDSEVFPIPILFCPGNSVFLQDHVFKINHLLDSVSYSGNIFYTKRLCTHPPLQTSAPRKILDASGLSKTHSLNYDNLTSMIMLFTETPMHSSVIGASEISNDEEGKIFLQLRDIISVKLIIPHRYCVSFTLP